MHTTMRSLLIVFSFSVLLAVGCNSKGNGEVHKEYFRQEGTRFHTVYHIIYESDRQLTQQIDSTLTAFNSVLNNFDSTSLISRFNRNETNELHPMLQDVVLQAARVSEATGGIYDITGAPLFDIWGFGTRKGVTSLATNAQVDSILAFVGYRKLHADTIAHTITKEDPRMILNPSSLSKGYVVDLVAQTLEECGVKNYMVEIGGEIVTKGKNPNGQCWNIGINKPIEDNTSTISELLYSIQMCDKGGVASSGDYRNYKVIDGVKLAHTMNALTGHPAHQDILAVTVIAPSCMEADAWATAFMAMGLTKSKEILSSQPQLKALFIYADPESGAYTSYEHGISPTLIEE